MPLTCSGGEWEGKGWAFVEPDDFSILQTLWRKRCKSCGELIEKGATCLEFARLRYPKDEIEIKIHGEDTEIMLAPFYWCEACGDQFFNLSSLGFCINPEDHIKELLNEYAEMRKPQAQDRKGENTAQGNDDPVERIVVRCVCCGLIIVINFLLHMKGGCQPHV